MIHAAGILMVAPDGHVLLTRRTDGQGWALPGGHIEDGETAETAARREFHEETGQQHAGDMDVWTRRQKDGVDFTTYIAQADKFAPILCSEHDIYTWADRKVALTTLPLHPGVRVALQRFDMDELGIAKAMRDGELTSPQRYGAMLLVDIRITGTGAAYRPTVKEFVWRDPEHYLNDEFLQRCNGLPVILDHPENEDGTFKLMDSEEFKERIAGTIFLPYLRDQEVWGIAKIYDENVAKLIEAEVLSTSPTVIATGANYTTKDGQRLLVEDKARLLESLAICAKGVWDKGGEPAGVVNHEIESTLKLDGVKPGELSMDETMDSAKAAADGITDQKEGSGLDKVLAKLDSLCSRMDAFEAKDKGDDKGKDDVKKECEPEPTAADKAKADAEEKAKMDAEAKTKADAELQAKADAEMPGDKKEEPQMDTSSFAKADSVASLKAQIAEMERRMPVEIKDSDRQLYVEAQVKADRVTHMFGDSAGAPRWVNGESLPQYKKRLLSKFKQHSAAWKAVDLARLDDDSLGVAETQIYADAAQSAMQPASMGIGVLRETKTTDATGRKISRFYGDPSACWDAFKIPGRRVTGWQTKFN